MVKCLHWAGEAVSSRPLCGVRSGARRIAILAISLAACFISNNNANAQNWTGSTVANAKDKTVYLWNVGAKQFLGKGGLWGTEAIISNVGTPFKVSEVSSGKTYMLVSLVKAEGTGGNTTTTTSGALGFMNGENSTHDKGNCFVDRSSADDNTYGTRTLTFSGSNAGYQITVTSKNGVSSGYNGTFYLVADMKQKKMFGVKAVNADSTDYSKWIIVTEAERKSFFEKAEASESSAVPATFLAFDNGFDRNDNNITYWQTKSKKDATGFDGTLSWKDNKRVLPSDACPWEKEGTYYTYTYTGSHTYTNLYTTYTHNVTYTVTTTTPPDEQAKTLSISCDKSTTSATYQHTTTTVTVTLDATKTTQETKTESNGGYTYYVGNGYIDDETTSVDEDGSTVPAGTHWQNLYGGDWTANIHGTFGVANQTIPNANMIREGWYKVSCVGFTTTENGTAQLYASAGTASTVGRYYAVQPLKKIAADDAPATYVKASRLVNGGGYEASVMVYVGKNDAGALKTLSFGVLVDGADDCAWTCFDDFQISYLGMPNSPLVLDETQTSVDYINAQTTREGETNAKKTLYLHRTLNNGKWNSIVLPVSLTVGQVKSAFGDDVHISAFKGAINENMPGRMYFEAINADRNNDNAVAIEAGKLYIMKPSKVVDADEKMDEVSFSNGSGITVTLNNYYTIPGVTFNDARKEFTAKVEGDKGDETYGNGKVQFVGTYVADNGAKQIPANSYVLRGNKDDEAGLWFFRTVETATKGFRGWLQVLEGANTNDISFSINGVVDDTTGISGLTVGGNGAATGNIYNLNGQLVRTGSTSTEGLAKGIYVVGGKKVVVK